MYIKNIAIKNIRSIASLDWSIEEEQAPGWHVFLGNNGSGKSTVIRAIALALIGPLKCWSLRQVWQNWVRLGSDSGEVHFGLMQDTYVDATGASYFSGLGLPSGDIPAIMLEASIKNV